MESESRDDVFGALAFFNDKSRRSFSQFFAAGSPRGEPAGTPAAIKSPVEVTTILTQGVKVFFQNGFSETYVDFKLNPLIILSWYFGGIWSETGRPDAKGGGISRSPINLPK
ncbi:MAG: hypothetical protein ACLFQQ_16440 [Desulfococcaceae bacterium]